MARALSATGEASVLANETTEEWILLLTVNHASFSGPQRFARRRTSIVSNSNTYNAAFFDLSFPDQTPNQLPRWQVTIDVVDQAVLAELRSVSTAPDIQIDVIRAAAPDTIEMTTGTDYKLRSLAYTGTTVTGEISMEDLLSEGFPGGRILPSNFPGGF